MQVMDPPAGKHESLKLTTLPVESPPIANAPQPALSATALPPLLPSGSPPRSKPPKTYAEDV